MPTMTGIIYLIRVLIRIAYTRRAENAALRVRFGGYGSDGGRTGEHELVHGKCDIIYIP